MWYILIGGRGRISQILPLGMVDWRGSGRSNVLFISVKLGLLGSSPCLALCLRLLLTCKVSPCRRKAMIPVRMANIPQNALKRTGNAPLRHNGSCVKFYMLRSLLSLLGGLLRRLWRLVLAGSRGTDNSWLWIAGRHGGGTAVEVPAILGRLARLGAIAEPSRAKPSQQGAISHPDHSAWLPHGLTGAASR